MRHTPAPVRPLLVLALAIPLAASCGDDGGASPFDSGGASATAGGTSVGGSTTAGTGTASGGGASSGGTTGSGGSSGGGGPKFDVGADGDLGGPTECGCGTDEWTYIWVANSSQGTVSKINTRTLEEEGRYQVRPDGAGSPSRTSVSLGGRAVAVASRHGGLTKIWAREQFCDPMNNGTPGLQTSTGPGDVLPWGQDDCVAWHTPFEDYTTQRPVAWGGQIDENTCEDQIVWTAGCGGGFTGGFGGWPNVFAHRVDGASGDILSSVEVTGFDCNGFGAYGGAVDTDGNFWISHNGSGGKLAVIRPDDSFEVYDVPGGGFAGYGITVDNEGRPWLSSYGGDLGAGVFDPLSKTWQTVPGFASQGGIQQGADGRLWVATVSGFGATLDQNGIIWIDGDTLVEGDAIPVPGGTVKGISVDVDGFVWAVTGTAYKLSPDAPYTQAGSYTGLSGPYTYSDMTGWGLQNAACNPEG